jgi:cytoskeletal protein CcmA (bactofilin family)
MIPSNSERGMALIMVLFSLVIVSALSAAMIASARTEFLIARNHEFSAHAQVAAEAGLNHAVELTLDSLRQWQANGFATRTDAINALFLGPDGLSGTTLTDADNGSLETLGIVRPPARLALDGAAGTTYEARVFDDDDPARGVTLTSADRVRIGENGNSVGDGNDQVVVRAIGYARGDTGVTLEATIGLLILPAIVSNGDLTISGNPTVTGTNGSVHANEDLTISGSPSISDDATASGTYSSSGNPTVGGDSGGARPLISIPQVNAIDYRPQADFILTSTGQLTTPGGAVICDASGNHDACKNAGYGWVFDGTGNWDINSNSAANGAYYVEGDAKISGSPGSAMAPLEISIIAEGSIEISGNPDLRPDLPEIMFVTDKDLKIGGNLAIPQPFEGQILVHEQLHISGNPSLAGQIIVENAVSVSNLVTANAIVGNPTIIYNGLVGSNTFAVVAWREVQ